MARASEPGWFGGRSSDGVAAVGPFTAYVDPTWISFVEDGIGKSIRAVSVRGGSEGTRAGGSAASSAAIVTGEEGASLFQRVGCGPLRSPGAEMRSRCGVRRAVDVCGQNRQNIFPDGGGGAGGGGDSFIKKFLKKDAHTHTQYG